MPWLKDTWIETRIAELGSKRLMVTILFTRNNELKIGIN